MGKVIIIPETALVEAQAAFPQYVYKTNFIDMLCAGLEPNPVKELGEYGFVHFEIEE